MHSLPSPAVLLVLLLLPFSHASTTLHTISSYTDDLTSYTLTETANASECDVFTSSTTSSGDAQESEVRVSRTVSSFSLFASLGPYAGWTYTYTRACVANESIPLEQEHGVELVALNSNDPGTVDDDVFTHRLLRYELDDVDTPVPSLEVINIIYLSLERVVLLSVSNATLHARVVVANAPEDDVVGLGLAVDADVSDVDALYTAQELSGGNVVVFRSSTGENGKLRVFSATLSALTEWISVPVVAVVPLADGFFAHDGAENGTVTAFANDGTPTSNDKARNMLAQLGHLPMHTHSVGDDHIVVSTGGLVSSVNATTWSPLVSGVSAVWAGSSSAVAHASGWVPLAEGAASVIPLGDGNVVIKPFNRQLVLDGLSHVLVSTDGPFRVTSAGDTVFIVWMVNGTLRYAASGMSTAPSTFSEADFAVVRKQYFQSGERPYFFFGGEPHAPAFVGQYWTASNSTDVLRVFEMWSCASGTEPAAVTTVRNFERLAGYSETLTRPFSQSVNDRDLAWLSAAVYRDDDKDELLEVMGYDADEWWVVEEVERGFFDFSGFAGFVALHRRLGQYVVAIRGTDDEPDWISNYIQGVRHDPPPQYDDALSMVQELEAKFAASECFPATDGFAPSLRPAEVVFTGHSLGSVLAELVAAVYGSRAVGFGCPGSASIMDRHAEQFNPSEAAGRTKCYAATGLVEGVNDHLGHIIRVFPEVEDTSAPVLPQALSAATDVHGIVGLAREFGTMSGLPRVYDATAINYWPGDERGLRRMDRYTVEAFRTYWFNTYYFEVYMSEHPTLGPLLACGSGGVDACRRDRPPAWVAEEGRTLQLVGSDVGVVFRGNAVGGSFRGGSGNDTFYILGGQNDVSDSGGRNHYYLMSHHAARCYVNITDSGDPHVAFIVGLLDDVDHVQGTANRLAEGQPVYLLHSKRLSFHIVVRAGGAWTVQLLDASANLTQYTGTSHHAAVELNKPLAAVQLSEVEPKPPVAVTEGIELEDIVGQVIVLVGSSTARIVRYDLTESRTQAGDVDIIRGFGLGDRLVLRGAPNAELVNQNPATVDAGELGAIFLSTPVEDSVFALAEEEDEVVVTLEPAPSVPRAEELQVVLNRECLVSSSSIASTHDTDCWAVSDSGTDAVAFSMHGEAVEAFCTRDILASRLSVLVSAQNANLSLVFAPSGETLLVDVVAWAKTLLPPVVSVAEGGLFRIHATAFAGLEHVVRVSGNDTEFRHDGSEAAPVMFAGSMDTEEDDRRIVLERVLFDFVPVNDPPVLHLRTAPPKIVREGTLALDERIVEMSDVDNSRDELTLTVVSVTGGSLPLGAKTTYSYAEVAAGALRIRQQGNGSSVVVALQLSDGSLAAQATLSLLVADSVPVPSSKSDSAMGAGAVAGIVLGVAAVVALAGVAFYRYASSRRRIDRSKQAPSRSRTPGALRLVRLGATDSAV